MNATLEAQYQDYAAEVAKDEAEFLAMCENPYTSTQATVSPVPLAAKRRSTYAAIEAQAAQRQRVRAVVVRGSGGGSSRSRPTAL